MIKITSSMLEVKLAARFPPDEAVMLHLMLQFTAVHCSTPQYQGLVTGIWLIFISWSSLAYMHSTTDVKVNDNWHAVVSLSWLKKYSATSNYL